MKKCAILILSFLIGSCFASAQEFSPEYDSVSREEFELEHYHLDENAEAIVLFDLGETDITNLFGRPVVVYSRKTRIKILNHAGLSYAEVNLPINQHPELLQMLVGVKGITYNQVQGEVDSTKLDVDHCYSEQVSKDMMIYKIPMPNVKVGSIIEYSYSYITPYLFNLPQWTYQNSIPTIYSSYLLNSNPYLEFTYLLKGSHKFDTIVSSTNENRHYYGHLSYYPITTQYIMKDIPAFIEEEYTTSSNDHIAKQSFQLSKVTLPNGKTQDVQSSWETFVTGQLTRKDFGGFVKDSRKKFRKIRKNNSLDQSSDKLLYSSLSSYVKEGFSWDYVDAQSASQKASDLFKSKTGNSCEINLFLVGLLQAAGFEAAPVMLSTRENGLLVDSYPFSHQMNYVVTAAKVNDQWVLTDAADPLCPNFNLPPRCLNDKGLMIKDGGVEWVNLRKMTASKTIHELKIDLTEAEYFANIESLSYLHDAYYNRSYSGNDTTLVRMNLRQNYALAKDVSVDISNNNSYSEPYKLNYSFSCQTQKIKDRIFVHPFLAEAVYENPFRQSERNYPVDLGYTSKKYYQSKIKLPDDLSIVHLPAPLSIQTESYDFDYSIFNNGNEIVVSMYIYIKKPVFTADEYTRLKEFYRSYMKKAREYIIFKAAG